MKHRICSLLTITAITAALIICCSVSAFAASGGDADVMMNGVKMEFNQDSLPKNVNGRIMVPYRAIFEYLGLEVGYDQATGVISGKTDDFSLQMKNGDPVIKLVYADGTSQSRKMDVAPYISDGRTFVATRFVSEMLGYSVGWDSARKTVIIIDADQLITDEDLEESFSILSSIESLNTDMSKSYMAAGSLYAYMETDKTTSISGDFSAIMTNKREELEMNLLIDGNPVKALVKYDADTGSVYMKADGISAEGQWLKVDMGTILGDDEAGMKNFISQTGAGRFSARDIILSMISLSDEELSVNSYAEMAEAYNELRNIMGDGKFKKTDSGYLAEFDDKVGPYHVEGKLEVDIDAYGNTVSYDMVITMSNDSITMVMDALNTALTSDVSLFMQKPDGKRIDISVVMEMMETRRKADISIPSGDTVLDMTAVAGALM